MNSKPNSKALTTKQPNVKTQPASVDEVIDQKIAQQVKDQADTPAEDTPLTKTELKAEARDAEHLNPAPEAPQNPAIPVSAKEAYAAMTQGDPLPSIPHNGTPEPIHGLTEQIEDEQAGEISYVATLEQAQNLPEADEHLKGKPAGKHAAFEFFKSHDGRTMRVIEVGGRHLAAQEVK